MERKNASYSKGIKKDLFSLMRDVPKLKRELPWLAEINAQSIQQALVNLDAAFVKFFRKETGFPKFKKKGKSKDSFRVPQGFNIDQKANTISLPKCGKVKAVIHRKFKGKAKSVTVSMSKSGNFFASVLVETEENDQPCKPVDPKTTIGIDLGIKTFLACSDGRKFDNPKFFDKAIKRLEFLTRQHSKKLKGGKNRERARLRLARQYEKVANQRRDFLHKLSHQLADENQVGTICVEDLNVKGMMANRSLARYIGDAGWGEFGRMLSYKCKWRGINLIQIGRFDPSSRLCPCGRVNHALTLKDREWTCPSCGRVHDRDLNAAKNIRDFGLQRAKVLETLGNNLESVKAKGGGPRRPKLGKLPVRNRER